jgi:adenosine 3'-phospho 5'-phosphosulfate transporter B3
MLTFLTMFLSNESLKYLNYPSQNIFKSSKVLPVIIVSKLAYNKKYLKQEYISASLLFISLVLFTIVDMKIDMRFNFLGVIQISGALFCDAYIGSLQEQMMSTYAVTTTEILTFTNFYSALFSLAFSIILGEIQPAFTTFVANGVWGNKEVLVYSFANIVGSYFILYCIINFGVYICTFITSLRKAATILISFFWFPKPFSLIYLVGYVLVSLSIALNMQAGKIKQNQKQAQAKQQDNHSGNHHLLEVEKQSLLHQQHTSEAEENHNSTVEIQPLAVNKFIERTTSSSRNSNSSDYGIESSPPPLASIAGASKRHHNK